MNNFYFKGLYKTTCYKTKSNLSQVFFSLTADECFSLFPYQNVFRHRAPHPPFQKVSTKSWSAPPSSKKGLLTADPFNAEPTLHQAIQNWQQPNENPDREKEQSREKLPTSIPNKILCEDQSLAKPFSQTLKHSFIDVLQNTRS